MSETVYVFGAGFNRSIRDHRKLKPPLATDLFRQAMRHEMLGAERNSRSSSPTSRSIGNTLPKTSKRNRSTSRPASRYFSSSV